MEKKSLNFSDNFLTESILLNSAINVSLAVFFVIPGLSGFPRVKIPEPALIRKLSPWP